MNHRLNKHLKELAETVDPYKTLNEKGKTLFPREAAATGQDYIRLVL